MLINQRQLKKVAVETQSGQFLGYVTGFELETDTGVIEKYFVRPKNVLAAFFAAELIISKSQIINFDESKMTVEDGVVKAKVFSAQKIVKANGLESTEPVITEKM
jgi:hypothetical protein